MVQIGKGAYVRSKNIAKIIGLVEFDNLMEIEEAKKNGKVISLSGHCWSTAVYMDDGMIFLTNISPKTVRNRFQAAQNSVLFVQRQEE